jgi:ABC-type nickel/cobalt efflux system permease component RcnA
VKYYQMLTLLTGFSASIAHVVTGPDHLAAVTPLAIDCRKRSWVVGFSWGVGHTLGMILIGCVFLLFREFISIDAVTRHSDTIVGFLLLCVGGWAIARTYLRHSHGSRPHPHFHTRPHLYTHMHRHTHEELPDHEHEHPGNVKKNGLAALSIGVVHGFSGFSHLVALLPSLALPTVWDSVLYIISFAVGTILSMIFFAFFLGFVAFRAFVGRKQYFYKWFSYSGGLLAIVIGIIWIVRGF